MINADPTATPSPGGADGDGLSWSELAGTAPQARVLAAVESVEPRCLSGSELVDAIVANERLLSHVQALQAGLMAAFSRPGVAGDLSDLVATLTKKAGRARGVGGEVDPEQLAVLVDEQSQALAAAEVAAALCIPHRTASERVGRAVELVDRLPLTWQALSAGRIDSRRAWLIAEATRDMSADLRSAVEKVIVPLAGSRVSGRVKELLDRAVLAADPDAAASRERTARAGRGVSHYPVGDGVGVIHARLTAEGASAVFTLLDLLAQHAGGGNRLDGHGGDGNGGDGHGGDGHGGDGRSIDARRADALTDICTELLDTGHLDLTGTCSVGAAEAGDCQGSAAGTGDRGEDTTDGKPADVGDRDDDGAGNPTDDGAGHRGAAAADCSGSVCSPDLTATGHSTDLLNSSEGSGRGVRAGAVARFDAATATTAGTAADTGNAADAPGSAGYAGVGDHAEGAGPNAGAGAGYRGGSTDSAVVGAVVGGSGSAGSLWRGLARHGRRPHLSVTIALSTLAGLDRLPGHLAGHGAITAELAKNLATAYGTLTLIGADGAAGTAATVSATVYRPRQATADQVIAAAGTCGFPSCRMPAWRCDVDHVVPFEHDDPAAGGLTETGNCSPECRRHHLLKTHAHWQAEGLPDRTMAWVSPTSHRYIDRPREFTLPGESTDPDVTSLFHPATATPPTSSWVPASGTAPASWPPLDDPDAEGRPSEPGRWSPRADGFVVTSNADPTNDLDPGCPGESGYPDGRGRPGDPGGPVDVLLRVRAIQRAQDRSTALARLRHLHLVVRPAPRSPLAGDWIRTNRILHTDPHESGLHGSDPDDTATHRYPGDRSTLRPTGTDDAPPF